MTHPEGLPSAEAGIRSHSGKAGGRHRVVIVGGGFGGLPAARYLGGEPVDVTLVDRRNYHLFQPLLYQTATGMLSPGQIAPALRHVVRKEKNVNVQLAEVVGFDLERRVVRAVIAQAIPIEIPYDSLIVATGAGQSYFGHDELALYAPGMKTLDDALELRRRIFGAFEMAELADDPIEKERWLTFVVVGAGPTGVELAGQIRELAVRGLRGEFRTFSADAVRVILVDGGTAPLSGFGDRLSGKVATTLTKLGIELRMGARVVGLDSSGVDVQAADGPTRIDAHTAIWAAGVQASPLAKMLADVSGAVVDRSGRIEVLSDLSIPGYTEVFAVGDMASVNNLPGVAEVAMQGGLHAANTILRGLDGTPANDFRYRDLGSVATIGRFRAVVKVRGLELTGFLGWLVWMFVHIGFLTGFGNRLTTMLRWLRSMVGRGRAERDFSTAHTGGDLSLPESVRTQVQPNPFPHRVDIARGLERAGTEGNAPQAEGDGDR
jgi:NADH:ubiquinone reductase (H+-translocating)